MCYLLVSIDPLELSVHTAAQIENIIFIFVGGPVTQRWKEKQGVCGALGLEKEWSPASSHRLSKELPYENKSFTLLNLVGLERVGSRKIHTFITFTFTCNISYFEIKIP